MDRIPNIHPGEILREEFLVPMGISQYRLAQTIHVPAMRISEICAGKRRITPDTAMRLAKALGTTAGFWLNLQDDYDLEEIKLSKLADIDAIEPLVPQVA